MRNIIIIILLFSLLFSGLQSRAQVCNGNITDNATGKALIGVSVINLASQQSGYSDADGNFEIAARAGDSITFYTNGYTTTGYRVTQVNKPLQIAMRLQNVQLKEVEVRALSQYQKDSIGRRQLYNKELTKQKIKPKWTGLGVDHLIGAAAQKVSRSYKLNKKFKKNFQQDEEQRYIDSRYTPELAETMTGLKGEPLALFMNAYPMQYQFARAASDLEMKMWIRDNYKTYKGMAVQAGDTKTAK